MIRNIIIWLALMFVVSIMTSILYLPVLIPGIVIWAYYQEKTLLKKILRERGTKIAMVLCGVSVGINYLVMLAQVGMNVQSLFGLLLGSIFIASWPAARYLSEKLPGFPLNPSKKRPDVLTSVEVKDAVKARCVHPEPRVYAGDLDETPLYLSIDDRAVVIGPPGTGKTVFLITQLLTWAEQGLPFIVNDIKPEIHNIVKHRLQQAGYKLITFNPTHEESERYNPFADVNSIESMGELIASFVPSLSDDNKIFSETARDLLDGIVAHLQTEHDVISLPLVRDFLSDCAEHEVLLEKLANSSDEDARSLAKNLNRSASNQRFLGSVMANLNANLRFLRYPKIRNNLSQSDFSLLDFCQPHCKVALFLQFEEHHQEITSFLFSAILSHVLRFFIEHTHRPPVLLLLDEIGNVPPVTGLVKKLNTIRSRKLPTWLYFQSKEQMQGYGQKANEGASMILGACDFQMVFRLNDNETADWMSQKIGTIDRLNTSVSLVGLFDRNTTRSLTTESIIFPHQLQQLPEGQAIASYRGLAWRNEAVAYYRRWGEYERSSITTTMKISPVSEETTAEV